MPRTCSVVKKKKVPNRNGEEKDEQRPTLLTWQPTHGVPVMVYLKHMRGCSLLIISLVHVGRGSGIGMKLRVDKYYWLDIHIGVPLTGCTGTT